MKPFFLACFLLLSLALGAEKPNVLLICVDDLRPELGCYGVDYISSPHIDGLAARGTVFQRHYVQAPTCGASRNTLLTGRYGSGGNDALFQRAKQLKKDPTTISPSLPAWLRENGYTTVSVGKVSHHPGGKGGPDWDDAAIPEMPNSWDRSLLPAGKWQHPRGWMHGLAHGEIRKNAKDMALYQAEEGGDEIYPDGPSINVALEELETLGKAANEKPFFLAAGILRPHLPFGAPKKYLEPYIDAKLPPIPHPEKPEGKTTWHGSGEFMKYNRWGRNPNTDAEFAEEVRKHYAACVSYADAQVGKLLAKLDELGLQENTIVILWGDHGWHLGEHAVWGKHTLYEESLRAPLIISAPKVSKGGGSTEAIVETLDLFPTLVDLAGLPAPEETLPGRSLRPLLENPEGESRPAYSYHRGNQSVRTDTHRFILHGKGSVELYDHRSEVGETKNVAEAHPEMVKDLREMIENRLGK